MPVEGVTGAVRTLRTAKFKLGYLKRGKSFPSDHDQIIGKLSDGITEEMIAAYGATPIPDANEAGVYNFGRELRGMIAFEFDARDQDGREVVLEILNRSWGKSRIRCSGTGGDDEHPGEAFVRDEAYKAVLKRHSLLGGERRGGNDATCLGRDCPLWYDKATKEDALPGCHREMRLHFVLLHPTKDRSDPKYMRQLGWIEVATGSWNGTIDVQSGLAIIRALAGGRTTFIPFRLGRVNRSVSTPTGRVNKATLLIDHDADEVLYYASGSPARALLRPEVRRELLELEQGERALALAPVTYADVADIQPQPRAALPPGRASSGSPATMDRDEALEHAMHDAAPPADDAGIRVLNQEERDALKEACGGRAGQLDTLGRFYELIEASYSDLGIPTDKTCSEWRDYPGTEAGHRPPLGGALTTRHRAWIMDRLSSESAPVLQGELLDPEPES